MTFADSNGRQVRWVPKPQKSSPLGSDAEDSASPAACPRAFMVNALAQNLAKLGFDLGEDPGRGAVVKFDLEGKAMVLVTGAETPPEFVEPVREHLIRTFGFDLGDVAATE